MKLGTIGRTPHLASRVAEWIRREIDAKRLTPGSRLPTEQFLAANFGVSRNVVREAIAELRSEGIVQSRQGVGAFVLRSEAVPPLRISPEFLADRQIFGNVFELRAILEIRAAGLAALRASPVQLRAIASALERMRREEKRVDAGVDADFEFHQAVALGTGNPYFAQVLNFVSEHMRESIFVVRRNSSAGAKKIIEITICEHEAINQAIQARQVVEARRTMAVHIRNAAGRLGYDIAIDENL